MDAVQDSFLAAMRQVQIFMGAALTPALAAINALGVMTTFNTAVSALTALGATQKESIQAARGETSNQKVVRNVLLETMARIAAIAKANLATVPELSSMTMPKSTTHSAQLIIAANAMATAAQPFAATFTGEGLATTFDTDLQAAATALQASIDGRKALTATAVGATAGTAKAVTDAKGALRVLDTFVVPALAGNTTLLAQWKSAKRVSKKPKAATGSTTVTPVVPTPAVANPPSTQEAA
jgi:hypothetical protein